MTARRETEFAHQARRNGFVRGGQPSRDLAARSVLWMVGAALAASLIVTQMGDSGLPSLLRLNDRHAELSAEVERLQSDIAYLERNLSELETNREFLERIARECYGMKGRNEMVIRVRGPLDR